MVGPVCSLFLLWRKSSDKLLPRSRTPARDPSYGTCATMPVQRVRTMDPLLHSSFNFVVIRKLYPRPVPFLNTHTPRSSRTYKRFNISHFVWCCCLPTTVRNACRIRIVLLLTLIYVSLPSSAAVQFHSHSLSLSLIITHCSTFIRQHYPDQA